MKHGENNVNPCLPGFTVDYFNYAADCQVGRYKGGDKVNGIFKPLVLGQKRCVAVEAVPRTVLGYTHFDYIVFVLRNVCNDGGSGNARNVVLTRLAAEKHQNGKLIHNVKKSP